MMRQIWLLARRDLVQRARSRSFLITVVLSVGFVLALGPLLSVVIGRPDTTVVGVTGSGADDTLSRAVEAVGSASGLTIRVESYPDRSTGETAVRDGNADVLVVEGPGPAATLVWKDTVDPRTETVVAAAVQQIERSAVAAELGLAPADVARLVAPAPPVSTTLAPPDPQRTPRLIAALAVVIILYIALITFGQFVLLGVMEEKASRVVEVVLSRARPSEVLAGKVLGIGLLGLIEMTALGAAALATIRLVDLPELAALPDVGVTAVLAMLPWFVLGYTFYAVVYAALGATVSRQEDVQGASVLPSILLLPGYFVGLTVVYDPTNAWARTFSLLPMWSPIVMPARIAQGVVPWWEIALSVALLVLLAVGLILLAGRIYAGAILRIGRKVALRDAWRSASSGPVDVTNRPASGDRDHERHRHAAPLP